jgi:arylsulfatase A-like enzyme
MAVFMPLFLVVCATGASARPNILVIVADDLGFADVGWHGSELKTPNLDQLARDGIVLEGHYVSPFCTPTRAALLTGRYWSRFGISRPRNTQVIPFDTLTLASALRNIGYATALIGKWHIGSKPEWGPGKYGFQYSYGLLAGAAGPWDHLYKQGPYMQTWHQNGKYVDEDGHVTDLIGRKAIAFLAEERSSPFFLYVPFTAPHTPLDEPASWLDRNKHVAPDRRQYAAAVAHMDDVIGKMIAAQRRRRRHGRQGHAEISGHLRPRRDSGYEPPSAWC